jgi:hypothetical protein
MKIKISVLAFFIFSITTHLISQIKCVPAITHVSCLGGTNGSIVIKNITGDNAPYNFMWQPTGTDIDSITNNEFGSYNLTISGSSGINTSFIYNIGYKIKWQNFGPDVFQNGDTLKSTTKVTWLKTANSSNLLSGSKNGWVEYVVTTTNENKLFGLLDSTSGSGWNDIDFALMLSSRSTINSCENGIQTALGTYAIGDVLRIERDEETILYKKNDEVIYRIPITNSMVNSSLTIRAAIYDAYSKLENLGCSFESVNASIEASTQTLLTTFEPVVNLYASTNVIQATYLWTPGGSSPTNSTTVIGDEGIYTISVTEPYYGCVANSTKTISTNRIIPLITHATNSIYSNGAISLSNVTGGSPPYTYTWQPTSTSSNNIINKSAGSYSVTIKGTETITVTSNYKIGYKTKFQSLYAGMSQSVDIINSSNLTTWLNTATSANVLPGSTDGWIQYVAENTIQNKLFGLLDLGSGNSWSDIDYGIMLNGSRYSACNNGAIAVIGSFTIGDVFNIEKVGNVINYKKNNNIVWTTSISTNLTQSPLIARVSLYEANSFINNFGCSFEYNLSNLVTTNIINYKDENNKGQISLNLAGVCSPYKIAWNGYKLPENHNYYIDYLNNFPNSTIDTLKIFAKLDSLKQYPILSDLQSGIFNNKIYDATNDSISFTTIIGNDFTWSASGVTTNTNSVTTFSNSNYRMFYGSGSTITQNIPNSINNYAISNCAINASNLPVYIEFKINSNSDLTDVGLKTASANNSNTENDMNENTYIHFTGNKDSPSLMQIYFNGLQINSSSYSSGDVISILLDPVTQSVSYSKNATIVYTVSTTSTSILSKDLQLKVVLRSLGSTLSNILVAGPFVPIQDIKATITDVNCSSSNSGIINFSPYSHFSLDLFCNYSVTGPNGYTNSGLVSSTNFLYGLEAGTYVITVPIYVGSCTTSPVSSIVRTFEVANMPDWVNQAPIGFTNVDPIDNSFNISSLQSSPYTWLGGASSNNVLFSNDSGWAEFKPKLVEGSPLGSFRNLAIVFGLNATDLNTSPADNDHFFYVKKELSSATQGLALSSSYLYGPYLASMSSFGLTIGTPFFTSSADVLRVSKICPTSSTMNFQFYKNNSLLASTTGSNISADLVADISVNQKNQFINKPRISFGCKQFEQYAVLYKKLNSGYYTCPNRKLFFKYNEEYDDKDNLLTYNVYDKYNKIIISNISNTLPVVYGDNRYTIDLTQPTILLTGASMPFNEYYILEVINEKNEKWYLRFKK